MSSWSRLDQWCSDYGWNTWTESTGGGQPHNNLQPYAALYMWKRTA